MAQASARHILVSTEDKCNELKTAIENGADFAQVAKENSSCPSSRDGGNLGTFGPGQMVKEFDTVVFSAPVGVVQGPVKTQFGWHLVKLEDRRTKQPPAFEIVKDRIVQSLLLQKAQQTAVGLRGKSKIEIVDPEIKKTVDARNAAMQAQSKPAAAEPPKDAPKDAPAEAAKP